jgi:pyruvate dehydrogenase E2 component (dihydrolipoamide acetyltransferase)
MAVIKQPKDQSHFILPDLGEGVAEAELISWKVEVGQHVDEMQTLAEMETDKALVEVPSPWSGTVKEPPEEEREDAGTVVGSVDAGLTVSERFTRRSDENGTTAITRRALATPAVRRIAREAGIDINRVPGTGRGGRVTATDVHNFVGDGAAPAAAAAAPAMPLPPISADGVAQRIPFRGVRRKIAQALSQSIHTAVHFTVVDEVDVTALDEKRREYANVMGRRMSFLPFIMSAVCRALRQHPSLNANVDDANEEILVKNVINLGCAVDTEHGLMVPVIANADSLSLVHLGDSVASAAAACRNRTIDRERLTGGTFTISNVGSYGGMFATPVINYPEVGILAAGRVHEKVLVRDGRFYAGKVLPLSLSCDHRVVDGAEGTRFLNTVRELLEAPDALVG